MKLDHLIGENSKLEWEDALSSLTRIDWAHGTKPIVITYLPTSVGNPYQSLLYRDLPSIGATAIPATNIAVARRLAEQLEGSAHCVTHLHWLNGVTRKAKTVEQARSMADDFAEDLDQILGFGGHILWTVHNVLPHESRWPDVDVEIRKSVVQRAERIHAMSSSTQHMCAPYFEIPTEKIIHIPHPSYIDAYPSWMSRAQARATLGIPASVTVFLAFGRIRSYKGVAELIDAFTDLSQTNPGSYVLLIAGESSNDPEVQESLAEASIRADILVADYKIPDRDVQVFFRAADIGVYPYRQSLNSGAVALGLTFGLPAVIPSTIGEAAGADSAWAQLYNPSEGAGLMQALVEASSRLCNEQTTEAAQQAAANLSPPLVSAMFSRAVQDWLGGNAPTPHSTNVESK